jgi:hypothetical protein
VFEFHFNDKLLFSKKELGRHSEDGEILKLIKEDLG